MNTETIKAKSKEVYTKVKESEKTVPTAVIILTGGLGYLAYRAYKYFKNK